MFKTLAIASALVIAGTVGAQAAEIGVRHSSGGSHTNTHSGREWNNYNGSRLEQSTFEGQTSTRGRGNGNSNNGNGNAFGHNRDQASSSYEGSIRTSENYSGGSKSRFNGSAWSNFSETSTFAR